ncbi:3-isopropylmalate dehydratase small subunit [Anaeromyxobacter diazotrophicus]|uniref:3-isopropylmalate dehydratase small subunit n=1 Tax=Anaeromyxobacter diazotrophicus TaxID=2590199 RepID=A0A7I9VPC5_9BACT|nr:3-isopropylmalate dehydratase small subunit [Anaeromyxobacter diazotrophicus]GEJ58262.1 3-isopropylmalate dehydratase small subunit [Anaeromyxobacter diazotrophicus]
MEPLRAIRSRTVVLPRENVDTDQIIPARFLKVTDKVGLGKALFSDWRYDEAGAPRPDFALNRPEARGCRILVAGDNFGCGSSREHAPWALVDAGFQAVISTSIADIFRNNALKNGLVPVVVDRAAHAALLAAPGAEVTVSLEDRTVALPGGGTASFPIDAFARYCLMNGVDELGYLLGEGEAISAFERARGER